MRLIWVYLRRLAKSWRLFESEFSFIQTGVFNIGSLFEGGALFVNIGQGLRLIQGWGLVWQNRFKDWGMFGRWGKLNIIVQEIGGLLDVRGFNFRWFYDWGLILGYH